jgi:hypothetical protein
VGNSSELRSKLDTFRRKLVNLNGLRLFIYQFVSFIYLLGLFTIVDRFTKPVLTEINPVTAQTGIDLLGISSSFLGDLQNINNNRMHAN